MRFRDVVQALQAMVSAESLSSADGKRLTALVQPSSVGDDSGAPAAAIYKSSSGGVVGVLNDMLEKANTELEGARATSLMLRFRSWISSTKSRCGIEG